MHNLAQNKTHYSQDYVLTPTYSDTRGDMDIVELYLCQDALFKHQQKALARNISTETIEENNTSQENLRAQTVKPRRQKSIFHNFQKHLIAFLRKFISIQWQKTARKDNQIVAQILWQAFIHCESNNKKILNFVFGISQNKKELSKIKKSSRQDGAFNRIRKHFSEEQIELGQEFLRMEVADQADQISKKFMEQNSNIGKIQAFYIYFRCFVQDIKNGPLPKRVSRMAREMVLQKKQVAP